MSSRLKKKIGLAVLGLTILVISIASILGIPNRYNSDDRIINTTLVKTFSTDSLVNDVNLILEVQFIDYDTVNSLHPYVEGLDEDNLVSLTNGRGNITVLAETRGSISDPCNKQEYTAIIKIKDIEKYFLFDLYNLSKLFSPNSIDQFSSMLKVYDYVTQDCGQKTYYNTNQEIEIYRPNDPQCQKPESEIDVRISETEDQNSISYEFFVENQTVPLKLEKYRFYLTGQKANKIELLSEMYSCQTGGILI